MKRQILTIAAVLALVFAGAVLAQSANTTAPGPTTQQEPGLTNNNLPNPGNPQTAVGNQTQPVEEHGTAEGTATESIHQEQAPAAPAPAADSTTGSTTSSNTMDTSATNVDTGTATSSTDTSASSSKALPSTASDLPTVALIGLLALGAAFVVRAYSKRNA